MSTLLDAADHWERIAKEAREMAAWERGHGLDLSSPGQSTGDRNASLYERTTKSLRLQHETGEAHCLCHMTPRSKCPSASNGPTFLHQQGRY
jgi:hypothetical protein